MKLEHQAFAASFIVISVIAVGVASYRNYRPVYVQAGVEMAPTISPGSRLMVERTAYRKKVPDRFEIVLCQLPSDPKVTTALRVVGLGGERIQVSGQTVLVNSNVISLTSYLGGQVVTNLDPWVTIGVNTPAYVPSNCVFVLGDNVSNAKDSRFFGPLPLSLLLGRVKRVDCQPLTGQ